MAKVTFNKLGIKKVDESVKTVLFNDVEIEVKQYLPIQDKLTLIGNVINSAADGNRFPNNVKLVMYLSLEMLFAYTNLTFTDKQKEDLIKLYDMVKSSGLIDMVILNIPSEERSEVSTGVFQMAHDMYAQMNSVYGIMENIVADYSDMDMNAANIQQKLTDPNVIPILRDVMTKLG